MIENAPKVSGFPVCDPEIVERPGHVEIRFQLIDPKRPPEDLRTGKFVHLGMTPGDAMRLLAQLREFQKRHGLPDEPIYRPADDRLN